MKEYLVNLFNYIFGSEPEEVLLESLIEEYEEKRVRKALRYLSYSKKAGTLRPPSGRNNPYGLIEAIIKTDKKKDE